MDTDILDEVEVEVEVEDDDEAEAEAEDLPDGAMTTSDIRASWRDADDAVLDAVLRKRGQTAGDLIAKLALWREASYAVNVVANAGMDTILDALERDLARLAARHPGLKF